MKFGLREKVFVALLISIPLAEYWLFFRPSNSQKKEMIRRIEAQQAKLSAANRAVAIVGDLMKEIDSLTKAIEFFHSMLPSEKEIDKVLRETWQLAEANRLKTKSIRPLGRGGSMLLAAPVGNYAEQPIDIQLEGDFRGFYMFLLALEGQQRIVKILEMDLETLDKGHEGQIKAHFVMCVFFECGQPNPVHNAEA